jgi:hypothetical protein
VVEPVAVDVSPSPDKATSTKLMTDSPGVAELETLAKLEVLLVIEGVGAGAIPMPISTPPSLIDLEDVVTTEGLPIDTEVVNEELVLVEAIGLTKTGGSKTGGSKTGGNTSAGAALEDWELEMLVDVDSTFNGNPDGASVVVMGRENMEAVLFRKTSVLENISTDPV